MGIVDGKISDRAIAGTPKDAHDIYYKPWLNEDFKINTSEADSGYDSQRMKFAFNKKKGDSKLAMNNEDLRKLLSSSERLALHRK